MLKIRLRRMGSRHRPFYRVVVSDSHRVPRARALEELGYYDPRKTPATLSLNVERADHWMSRGAKPSDTVKRLLTRARVETPAETAEASVEKEAAVEAVADDAAAAEAEAETAKAAEAETAAEAAADEPAPEAAATEEPAAAEETAEAEAGAEEADKPAGNSAEAESA